VTEEARLLFLAIAERYLAAGCPERAGWHFDTREQTDLHRELESAGLIQRAFGVVGGFAWRLTDAGVERAQPHA
jgi:hypothetical protein